MPAVEIRPTHFSPQVIIVGGEQIDAGAVRRYVVDVLRKNILRVTLKVRSPSSAYGQSKGVPAHERRRLGLLKVREIWIRSETRGGQWGVDIPHPEEMRAMQEGILQREPSPSADLFFNTNAGLQEKGSPCVGCDSRYARKRRCGLATHERVGIGRKRNVDLADAEPVQ